MTNGTGLGSALEHPFEDPGARSGPPDALVLDIGGDIGALVIYADEACLGQEIDLTPVGQPQSHHLHTMVWRRRATNKDIIAGLYPEVRQGEYVVWGLHGTGPLGQVTVLGGRVAEFHGGHCLGPRPASILPATSGPPALDGHHHHPQTHHLHSHNAPAGDSKRK